MNQVEFLMRQTEDAYQWTNRLITSIPLSKWEDTPPIIDSNVSWQVGHLIMSIYFHSIAVIKGPQMSLGHQMPIKQYAELYTDVPAKNCIGTVRPEDLNAHLKIMQEKSSFTIKSLSEDELAKELAPTPVSHPIAKNKFEALDWNIKHTMWHCGQLGILKRTINGRYDFGLRKVISTPKQL